MAPLTQGTGYLIELMAVMENSFMKLEISMKELGLMTKLMAMGFILAHLQVAVMKDSGFRMFRMATVLKSGKMGPGMKAISKEARKRG